MSEEARRGQSVAGQSVAGRSVASQSATDESRRDPQAEVIAFLCSPAAYAGRPGSVERYETHGALVFAAGGDVYKIKRAVRFPYMDFSTLAKREAVIRRELEVNRMFAPELYLGVVPIARDAGGRLSIGGQGEAVEWALHMRRFQDDDLVSAIARRHGLSRALALAIADAVARSHARAAIAPTGDGAGRIARVIEEIAEGLAAERHAFTRAEAERFEAAARQSLEGVRALLDDRARGGAVRRCHGDLHLGNIVVWQGRPLLFDALEFSEELATIDTLYDLAFLLMDLDIAGGRKSANLVLNRYLLAARPEDVDGLASLPLFLAARAGIRAMVGAERAAQQELGTRERDTHAARRYFERALEYLGPHPVRLVAIGGFSGTGKSTLAAALAPGIGAAPGALHVRADVERKAMLGVAETVRLPAESYTPEAARRVYAAMMDKARRAIEAGHSVVIDAVFSRPGERAAAEEIARSCGVSFTGLWLTASRDVLIARVGARVSDASDATPAVVEGQLARGTGEMAWAEVQSGGSEADTVVAASKVIERR